MDTDLIKQKIFDGIVEYFAHVDPNDLKPSNWKVPIGGGFYDDREVNAVVNCYLNGSLSIQKSVNKFEHAFSAYVGVKHGIACNSGTSANILALNTLLETGELKRGDEVALPATTFISVASPVIQLGLKPVYLDVDPENMNLDPAQLSSALAVKNNIKCVIAVHTLGNPADMNQIMDIAKEHDLKVIEDCCEAHGAAISGKKVGSFGDMATWSFYVAHHMTTAEGGMVVTNSDQYAEIVQELREFGRNKSYSGERYGFSKDNLVDFDERYVFRRIGWNFRMADAPAAFGLQQLKKLDQMNDTRAQNSNYLIENLAEFSDFITLPKTKGDEYTHTYYSFPLVIKEGSAISRKHFVQYLEANGIETRAIMCGSLPDQPSLFKAPGRDHGDLYYSRYLRDNAFFIGCHPCLKTEDLDHVVEMIRRYFNDRKN